MAVIELKILDESCSVADVAADLFKIKKPAGPDMIGGYAGLLICEKGNSPLDKQIKRLEETLLRRVYHTWSNQNSADHKWQWCFGCAAVFERSSTA